MIMKNLFGNKKHKINFYWLDVNVIIINSGMLTMTDFISILLQYLNQPVSETLKVLLLIFNKNLLIFTKCWNIITVNDTSFMLDLRMSV